jgi:Flp pilus assembly protein TadD
MKRVLAAALLAVTAALALVVHVPAGTLALRSWRGGGTPALLDEGFALRVPWLHTIERFPGGVVTTAGTASVSSREGATIGLPYEVRLRPIAHDLLGLARDSAAGGARGALGSAIERDLLEAAAGIGTHDLAAGVARPALESRLRDQLRDRFAGAEVEIRLGEPSVPSEVRASFARQAIYGRRVDTGMRVVLVGLDGADWDVMDPMIARGELPRLARLRREGVWARLRSNVPTLSPLLWTTVATGKSPDRHGINDFLVEDPRTGQRVPINSTFRKVRAFWNILSEAGIPVDVIAWWASWPAEAVTGHLVSDRVAYSTFNLGAQEAGASAVFPPAYAADVARLRLRDADITWRDVSRFLDISEGDFRAARAVAASKGAVPSEAQHSINVFVRVLAATETYRRIALDLLRTAGRGPGLVAVYFQGIDEVNHRFAHCAPPDNALCTPAERRRFGRAVAAFYRYQDTVLGEILDAAPGATTLVLSDHGFASGGGRPDDVKPFIEGKPGLWHDLVGIFMAAGPGIGRGEIPTVTLFDITPTLLHLLGLPVPEDMSGKVLEKALTPAFMTAHPIQRVPSYEGLGPAAGGEAEPARRAEALSGAAEDEIVEQLRSLGYIGGEPAGPQETNEQGRQVPPPSATPGAATGPAGVPTLLYHTNLGAVYLAKRLYDQAEAEYRKALALEPEAPEALTGMAALEEARGRPERALEILRGLADRDPGESAARLARMAEMYVRIGRAADGATYFRGLPGTSPRFETARQVALGIVLAGAGRPADAEKALDAALALDPASLSALQEMFTLLDGQDRAADMEPRLRRAIGREPKAGMLYNWLGLICKRRGDLRAAEIEFRKALEVTPELVGSMANLGGIYIQQGRGAEAVAVLQGALEKEPRDILARTNLVVALGLEHDVAAARARVEEAEKQGQRAPVLYNALAYTLHLNGRDEEALDTVAKALAIDPRQPDSVRLRQEIEEGRGAIPSGYR